jgi:hypothetical protein
MKFKFEANEPYQIAGMQIEYPLLCPIGCIY